MFLRHLPTTARLFCFMASLTRLLVARVRSPYPDSSSQHEVSLWMKCGNLHNSGPPAYTISTLAYAWLLKVPEMDVRSKNSDFLAYSKLYIDKLAAELAPMMITNGGPILMVQIENEYGSYGTETTYMEALRDTFSVFGVKLCTNDGAYEEDVINGQVYGVLAEVDGNSVQQIFEARDAYADPSSLGPLLDGGTILHGWTCGLATKRTARMSISQLRFWISNLT